MSFSISEENKFITLVYDLAKKSATNIFAFQHNQISKLMAFQMLLNTNKMCPSSRKTTCPKYSAKQKIISQVKKIVINHQISSDPSFGKHYRAVMLLHSAVVHDDSRHTSMEDLVEVVRGRLRSF